MERVGRSGDGVLRGICGGGRCVLLPVGSKIVFGMIMGCFADY